MAGEGKPKLGYIGLGLMGAPMTARLLAAGYDVAIWNRSADKMAPLVAKGAKAVAHPRDVAEHADILMMCLTAAPAVREVVFGPNGVAEARGAGRHLVDFSSMRPDLTAQWSKELKAKSGRAWIDAPVSGGVPGAEKGTLAIMAGGEAADVEAVRPVVMPLCQRFTHMGPSGAGQTTKLVNQMFVGTCFALMAEAMLFARKAGVDAARIPEALKGGWADSLPLQYFGPRFARRQLEPRMGELYTMVKDLDTAADVARMHDVPAPVLNTALQLFRQMVARGHGGDDITALAKVYEP